VIGWLLRRWQYRYPTTVLLSSLALAIAGLGLIVWWIWRDLTRGMLLRPVIAVMALAVVSIRVIMTFNPHRQARR